MGVLTDRIADANFGELIQVLFSNHYFDFVFPFLLAYAVFFSVLGKVKIFQHSKGSNKGKPIKSVIAILSGVISFYGISFELSGGYTVGEFISMLFPNISALTIAILCFFVIGSLLGKDFFSNLFREDISTFAYLAGGIIGLGVVLYYGGIVLGFWDATQNTNESYWNFIIAIAFLILGLVLLFRGPAPVGILLLIVFFVYVANYGETGSILQYFVDPVVFIVVMMIAMFAWMNADPSKSKVKRLEDDIKDSESIINDMKGHSSIKTIAEAKLKAKKKKLEKLKEKQKK